jgi:putative transposase
MTLSDGKRIQSPLFLKHAMREKKRRDRRISRCKEGSNHHHQATTAKARLEERITNKRNDWQWKIAHQLCREYDNICIEDLELEGMKKLWGRKMEDLAHGNFVKKLEYLACRYGVNVLKVDRFFPSSRLCECGHIYKTLTLNDREWVCSVCGRHHDRDLHAANNILRQGIASLGSPRKTRKSTSVVSALGRKHPRIPRQ